MAIDDRSPAGSRQDWSARSYGSLERDGLNSTGCIVIDGESAIEVVCSAGSKSDADRTTASRCNGGHAPIVLPEARGNANPRNIEVHTPVVAQRYRLGQGLGRICRYVEAQALRRQGCVGAGSQADAR